MMDGNSCRKTRLQMLRDLLNQENEAKEKSWANARRRTEIADITNFSSPPSSPVVSSRICESISPIRSPLPLRKRVIRTNNISISPPATPPSKSWIDEIDIDSPTASQEVPKTSTKRKLVEELKRAVTHHKTSVRNLERAGGKGVAQLDESNAVNLLILKCITLNLDGGAVGFRSLEPTLALCVEVVMNIFNGDQFAMGKGEAYEVIQPPKRICFKQKVPGSISKGLFGTLYPPWGKCFIPTIGQEVIYATDFFQPVDQSGLPQKLAALLKASQNLETVPLTKNMIGEMISGDYGAVWNPFRPCAWISRNTIAKQTSGHTRFPHLADLDTIICQTWANPTRNSIHLLAKDFDNHLALIEVQAENRHANSLQPGVHCRFKNLFVVDKVTPEKSVPLFGVIALFNPQQADVDKFYFSFCFHPGSTLELVPNLQITFEDPRIQKIHVIQLVECPYHVDSRFMVEGILTRKSSTEAYFRDKTGAFPVRVLPSFGWERIILGQPVILTFLRMFRGICTLDKFSTIKMAPRC